jgi:hypothetical protein
VPVLRDELTAVATKQQNPRERLRKFKNRPPMTLPRLSEGKFRKYYPQPLFNQDKKTGV